MDNIIEFPREETYLEDMSRPELEAYLAQLERRLADLDAREPRSMTSPAYDDWADEHEVLEDAIDEVRELLED